MWTGQSEARRRHRGRAGGTGAGGQRDPHPPPSRCAAAQVRRDTCRKPHTARLHSWGAYLALRASWSSDSSRAPGAVPDSRAEELGPSADARTKGLPARAAAPVKLCCPFAEALTAYGCTAQGAWGVGIRGACCSSPGVVSAALGGNGLALHRAWRTCTAPGGNAEPSSASCREHGRTQRRPDGRVKMKGRSQFLQADHCKDRMVSLSTHLLAPRTSRH